MTTLWRAVDAANPYLGRGSFWSPSAEFVALYGRWLIDTTRCQVEAYRVDVDIASGEHLEYPADVVVDPTAVAWKANALARTYRWVSFCEAPFDGVSIRQYLYLGDAALPARKVSNSEG